jgi:hypothetical protein
LLVSGAIIAMVALVDWWTKPYISLGFLYLFAIIVGSGFSPALGRCLTRRRLRGFGRGIQFV